MTLKLSRAFYVKAFTGLSFFLRAASAAIAFLFIARHIAPAEFGALALYFSIGSLFALFTDYGLNVRALRDIAVKPDHATAIMRSKLWMKTVILTLALIPFCGAVALLTPQWLSRLEFWLILLSTITNSYAEFILVMFRATGKNNKEAAITAASSAAHLVLLCSLAMTSQMLLVTLGFAISRSIYLIAATGFAEREYRLLSSGEAPEPFRFRHMKIHAPYAVDAYLTTAFNQIDVILISFFLGAHATGIYQSGARIMQIVLPVIQVFSTVYVPILARQYELREGQLRKRFTLFVFEMAVIGVAMALGMNFVLPLIMEHLLGAAYAPVNALWPGFGLLVIARCLAAPIGVLMIAVNRPNVRVVAQSVVLGVFVAGAPLLPKLGLPAIGFIQTAAIASGTVVYLLALASKRPTTAPA